MRKKVFFNPDLHELWKNFTEVDEQYGQGDQNSTEYQNFKQVKNLNKRYLAKNDVIYDDNEVFVKLQINIPFQIEAPEQV